MRAPLPLSSTHLEVLLHLLVQRVQGMGTVLQQDAGFLVPLAPLFVHVFVHLLAGHAQCLQGLLGQGLGPGRAGGAGTPANPCPLTRAPLPLPGVTQPTHHPQSCLPGQGELGPRAALLHTRSVSARPLPPPTPRPPMPICFAPRPHRQILTIP